MLAIIGSAPGGCKTEAALQAEFGDLDLIRLHEKRISPYRYDGVYPEDDDFLPLIQKILDHDILVLASPVYWYAVSGPMKMFLDRFSDLISGHKDLGRKLKGMEVRFFATGSDANPPVGLDVPISLTAVYFDMVYQGMTYMCTREC